MINFRKLLHDFSSQALKEGKQLFESGHVGSIHLVSLNASQLKFRFSVEGGFQHEYKGEIEIDPHASEMIYGECDCAKHYDCEHVAAACYKLEDSYDQILSEFSGECQISVKAKKEKVKAVEKALKTAQKNAARQASEAMLQESLQEYKHAASLLRSSVFFQSLAPSEAEPAEISLLIHFKDELKKDQHCEVQLILRLMSRVKPVLVSNLKAFLDSFALGEEQLIAGRWHCLKADSFSQDHLDILRCLHTYIEIVCHPGEKEPVCLSALPLHALGQMLTLARSRALEKFRPSSSSLQDAAKEKIHLEPFYVAHPDQPLTMDFYQAEFEINFHRMDLEEIKIMMEVFLNLGPSAAHVGDGNECVRLHEATLLASPFPGVIYSGQYFSFPPSIQREHLLQVQALSDLIIPKPLIGTLIEIGLPELKKITRKLNLKEISKCVTRPMGYEPKVFCELIYQGGKLDARLEFEYGFGRIPSMESALTIDHIQTFVSEDEVFARDLWREQAFIEALFGDFQRDEDKGLFTARSEKMIVEFMTKILPAFREKVNFTCPAALFEQFIYNDSKISLHAYTGDAACEYILDIKVKGPLEGVSLNQLWECVAHEKPYIELCEKQQRLHKNNRGKILVLDLDRLRPLLRWMDDLAIDQLKSQAIQKPFWSLTHLEKDAVEALDIEFKMEKDLEKIQKQLWDPTPFTPRPVSSQVQATLRPYQVEGVNWLEKLRRMRLSGILADDMGLGKTLQAIAAITHLKEEKPHVCSLVVCPTSLVYNWKEEIMRFNPKLRLVIIDGSPNARKKSIEQLSGADIAVTSYSLLQKDIEHYEGQALGYVILDEAQHIKNRHTQNAKCVRQLKADHRLAMTGTPIENALEELWSLFDFLMPGLMSSYDRFIDKYIKKSIKAPSQNALHSLKRKMAPFVLRRMKSDVLDDLPEVSEIVYHCELLPAQKQLYTKYANSARDELTERVRKEGFERARIHVLATLTRLKQICCHPALFAQDLEEANESSKYEMLWQIVDNVVAAGRKAVVFSQYTKMLQLMKTDLQKRGIEFCYLDGTTKSRMEVVHRFNETPSIPLFLVSLKAGGTGMNLTGADTVIHYDLWWNPAVEDQATDRVHRMGQKSRVSSYKLVTLGTIEEKIVELQNRKKGLVRQLVVEDEDAIEKLTWEEVLQLLET